MLPHPVEIEFQHQFNTNKVRNGRMGIIAAIVLLIIGAGLFIAKIPNETLERIANIAGILALISGIIVLILEFPPDLPIPTPVPSLVPSSTSTVEISPSPTSEPTSSSTSTLPPPPPPATLETPTPDITPTKDVKPTPELTGTPTNPPPPTSTPTMTSTPTPKVEIHRISGASTGVQSGSTYGASERSWYLTGMYIPEGASVSIQYIGGEWWIGKRAVNSDNLYEPQTPTDANGYQDGEEERVIAEMVAESSHYCEALISAPIGSLIGRIGENGAMFFVGNDASFIAEESGILYLRINYNTRVGYAFFTQGECPRENGGEISVRVIVIP